MATDITTRNQNDQCSADFTINGEQGSQSVGVGQTLILEADDTEATTYKWEVTADPPDCDYQLENPDGERARLTLPESPCTFVIQLGVTKGQCAAQARQIVWAVTPDREYRLPATGEPLRFNGDEEWAGDLGKVIQDADAGLLKDNERGALDAIPKDESDPDKDETPTAENPLLTERGFDRKLPEHPAGAHVPEGSLPEAPNAPSAENKLLAERDRPPHPEGAHVPEGSLPEAPNAPSETNQLLTEQTLPDVHPPEGHLGENESGVPARSLPEAPNAPSADNKLLTERDRPPHPEGVHVPEGSLPEAPNAPSETNKLVTQAELEPHPEGAHVPAGSLPEAPNAPSADNKLVTESCLAEVDGPPADRLLKENERDALDAVPADETPATENPLLTERGFDRKLPEHPAGAHVPEGSLPEAPNAPSADNKLLTERDRPPHPEGVHVPAGSLPDDPPPSAENRLVTMEGIRPDGAPQVYVVAADTVDLTDLGPPQTRGRIGVVDNDPTRGLATLTFLGYELNPDDGHYVVKALAVNEEPALKIPGDDVHIVQFVGFASDGFKLHMSIVKPEHPVPHTEHNLGTCMIEVSKVVKRRLAD